LTLTQAEALGRNLERVTDGAFPSKSVLDAHFGPVFCSTATRAVRTAEIMLQNVSLAAMDLNPRRHHGIYMDVSCAAVTSSCPAG